MPAVPAALTEIEERLQEIRYRLNLRTLIAVLCPVVAALLVLATLLVWSASRGTKETFPLSLWATAGAALLVLFRGVTALGQRWVSLDQAARLADDRGRMADRLTTLHWLARSGNQTPLTPVLVADAIDRGAAWRPAAIAPRRFPFELGYVAAGALFLFGVLYWARNSPPAVMPLPEPGPPPAEKANPEPPMPPPAPEQAEAEPPTDPLLAFDVSFDADAARGGGEGAEEADGGAFAEQLRRVLKKAVGRPEPDDGGAGTQAQVRGDLDAEKLDGDRGDRAPNEPGAGAGEQGSEADQSLPAGERGADGGDSGLASAPGRQNREGRSAGGQARPDSAGDARERNQQQASEGKAGAPKPGEENAGAKAESQPPPADPEADGKPGRPSEESAAESQLAGRREPGKSIDSQRRAAPNDPSGRGTRPGGANPAAGPGGDPEGLFGTGGGAVKKAARAPGAGTFKLTLGSFLGSSPAGENQKVRDGNRATGREAVAEPPALHPNQTADDAMRRADIPPEYEDIVRRIYSARPPAK